MTFRSPPIISLIKSTRTRKLQKRHDQEWWERIVLYDTNDYLACVCMNQIKLAGNSPELIRNSLSKHYFNKKYSLATRKKPLPE